MRCLIASALALGLCTTPVLGQDDPAPTQQTVALELFGLAIPPWTMTTMKRPGASWKPPWT